MDQLTLKYYLDFSDSVDLRAVRTMPDVSVSYALGSRLVNHSHDGQIISGIASSWHVSEDLKQIEFILREDAKWSDGSRITSSDVVNSFADCKAHYFKEIPSLFESYTRLEAVSANSVRFTLNKGIQPKQFLEKLTEPMHGLTKIENGRATMNVTSGPYSVESLDHKDLVFRANKFWYKYSPQMFSKIHIRRPKAPASPKTLINDLWPDVVNIPSIFLKSELDNLGFSASIWRRNNDRLVNLSYGGKNALSKARAIFGYLSENCDFRAIAKSIDHASVATQVYTEGLALYSSKPFSKNNLTKHKLEEVWGTNPVKFGYAKSIPETVRQALEEKICASLPVPCEFIAFEVKDLHAVRLNKKFDFILSSVGVDSINLDGGMSYYFELSSALIPSDESGPGNFVARLKKIRHDKDVNKVDAYRDLLFDAVDGHYFMPLFHCSSTVIGREDIDLSQAPISYEVVLFETIRRRKR